MIGREVGAGDAHASKNLHLIWQVGQDKYQVCQSLVFNSCISFIAQHHFRYIYFQRWVVGLQSPIIQYKSDLFGNFPKWANHHRTTANLSDIVWCMSGVVWWCLEHVWWCLVVSDACLVVSGGVSRCKCILAGMTWIDWCIRADIPSSSCNWCWCTVAADALMLLMHCCCWCADAAAALMLLKCWCCWCTVAAKVLLLRMCWCCWWAVAADALMLQMCWCADDADAADALMLLMLLMCWCFWCADASDALMLLMH